jgi:hypothetical protein
MPDFRVNPVGARHAGAVRTEPGFLIINGSSDRSELPLVYGRETLKSRCAAAFFASICKPIRQSCII